VREGRSSTDPTTARNKGKGKGKPAYKKSRLKVPKTQDPVIELGDPVSPRPEQLNRKKKGWGFSLTAEKREQLGPAGPENGGASDGDQAHERPTSAGKS